MLEALRVCEAVAGRPLQWTYSETSRTGDHIWWISDVSKFACHYPGWRLTYDITRICREMYEANRDRWSHC
jgi:CDP-paratose 2-epimerase